MSVYLFAVPLAAGKTGTWKNYMKELAGSRYDDYKKSRKKIGLNVEQVFLQQTPHGDMCVVRWETENPQRVFETLAKSNDPFDTWFRDKILIECHNMDFSQAMPLNQNIFNHQETQSREYAGA
jgi:hypothetical protein